MKTNKQTFRIKKLTNRKIKHLKKILATVLLSTSVFYVCGINILTVELVTANADESTGAPDLSSSPTVSSSSKSNSNSNSNSSSSSSNTNATKEDPKNDNVETNIIKDNTVLDDTKSKSNENINANPVGTEPTKTVQQETSPATQKTPSDNPDAPVGTTQNENAAVNNSNTNSGNNNDSNTNSNNNSAPDVNSNTNAGSVNANQNISVPKVEWQLSADQKTAVIGPVELGVTYKAPQDEQVTVTFTKLPENPGKLSIEEITLTDEQASAMHALSNKAYDVTSDMPDGSFKYELTLPKPKNEQKVEIKYAENVSGLTNAEAVSDNLIKTDTDSISATLDHFTIFVVTSPEATYTGSWIHYPTQGYENAGVDYPTTIPAGQTATWSFSSLSSANYDVYISWSTHANRTTSAPYTLNYAGSGTKTFNINQEQLADQTTTGGSGQWSGWYHVGEFALNSSSSLVLTSVNNSSGSDYVIADAVAIVDKTAPSEVWVDDGYTPTGTNDYHIWGYDAFATIQEALAAIGSGGIVNVAAGTYSSVDFSGNIKNNVDLRSTDGAAATFIQGMRLSGTTFDGLTIDGFTFQADAAGYGNNSFNIDADGSYTNLIIKNSVFDGESASGRHAIFVNRGLSGFSLLNNTFKNYNNSGGEYSLVFLESQGSAFGNDLTITGNAVNTSNTTNSFEAYRWKNVNISNNTINTPSGRILVWTQPNESNLESVKVNNNTLNLSAGKGIGLYYFNAPSEVKNNSISGASVGVFVLFTDPDLSGSQPITFTNNSFNSNAADINFQDQFNNLDAKSTVSWSVLDQKNIDQIENVIKHNCAGSPYSHGICNADDYGSGGSVDYWTSDTTPPAIPTLTSPSNGATVKPAGLFLDWSDSVDSEGSNPVTYYYQSSYSPTVGGSHNALASTIFTSGALTDSRIDASGTSDGIYYWQVKACDSLNNCSDWSGPWEITVDNTAPSVNLVFPTPGSSATSFQAVFSEDVDKGEAENPANYFLNNWPGAGGNGDLVGDATISYNSGSKTATITFTNAGWYISPEQQWGVQNIHDLAGNLQSVNPYTEYSTSMTPPTDPGTPVSTPNPTNSSSQSWTWAASTDISGSGVKGYYQSIYDVLATTNSAWLWIGDVLGVSTNLTDGQYQLQLKAEDNAGNQSGIVSSSTLTVDTIAPSAPSLVAPANNAVVKGSPTLINSWSPVSGAVKYIYESYNNSSATSLRYHGEFTATSKSASNVADTTFWWRVQAVDAAGNKSPWSDLWKVTVDNTAPVFSSKTVFSGWYNTTQTSVFHYTDANMADGYSDPTCSITTEGTNQTCSVSPNVCDKAGNCNTAMVISNGANIDKSGPTIPGQIGWSTENPLAGSDYTNGSDFDNYKTCGQSLNFSPMTNLWGPSTDTNGVAGYDREVYSPDSTTLLVSHSLSTNYVNGGGAIDGATYWVRVRAYDALGNKGDWTPLCAITYDITPPVISLTGTTPDIEVGGSYTELGAIASDAVDGSFAATPSGSVDTTTVGSYTITYNATDAAGNSAVPVTRTVNVVDTTAPVITLNGDNPVTLEVHTPYVDAGAVATDNYDPNANVTTPDSVDTDVVGVYTLHYNHTDSNGNPATEVTRTVNVVDTTKPIITLSGITPETVEMGTTYVDSGATAMDNYDGDLTSSIDTVNSVNSSALGTYSVTYDVTDSNGNAATQVIRTVNVVDTIKPESTITTPINSGSGSTISINNWTGAISGTAVDNAGGSGVNKVKISIRKGAGQYWNGSSFVDSATELLIDTALSGNSWQYNGLTSPADDIYTITSHAVDVAGNQENSYKLIIVNDKTIPEIGITINPANPNGENGWYITKPQITLAANDNFNVDKIEYQLNGTSGQWTTYNGPVTLDDGAWSFYYRAIDKASNVSNIGLKNVKVDTKAPNQVANLKADYTRDGNKTTLTWDINDPDIYRIYVYHGRNINFSLNNHTLVSNDTPIDGNYTDYNVLHNRRYYYKILTIDEAGNAGVIQTISIKTSNDPNPRNGGGGGNGGRNNGGGNNGGGNGGAGNSGINVGANGGNGQTGANNGNEGNDGNNQTADNNTQSGDNGQNGNDALTNQFQEDNTVSGELQVNGNTNSLPSENQMNDNSNNDTGSNDSSENHSIWWRIWNWLKSLF